jgi:hypothetical protein
VPTRPRYPEIADFEPRPLRDVRTAVLNDTLKDAFRHRYPGFRPANSDEAVALTS